MRSTRFWMFGTATVLALACLGVARQLYQRDAPPAWAEAVAVNQQLQDAAFQAYRAGEDELAVPALEAYLAYLEQAEPLTQPWRPGQSPWLDARALADERMLTVGRLASIVERARGEAEAADLWARAVAYAREAGRPDVSLSRVREAIVRQAPVRDAGSGPAEP